MSRHPAAPAPAPNPISLCRRYFHLFQGMAQGVIYRDSADRVIAANPAAERILGVTLTEMQAGALDDPARDQIREDGSPFPLGERPATVALRTGREASAVVGVRNRVDGERRWIAIHAVPVVVTPGEPPAEVFTTFEDITGQKRMEQQLRASDERFQELFENAPHGLAEATSDGIVVRANRAYCRLLGCFEADLVGRPFTEWNVGPSGHNPAPGTSAPYPDGGVVPPHERLYRCGDGSTVWVETTISTASGGGRPVKFVTVRDISAIKAAEQAKAEVERLLSPVLAELPLLLFAFDTNGIVTLATGRTDANSRSPAPSLAGRSVFELWAGLRITVPSGEIILFEDYVPQVLAGQSVSGTAEVDGRQFFGALLPLRDGQGTVVGATGFSLDITDQKRVEHQLLQSQKIQAVGQLAGGIAHDFNNVLAVILGRVELLEDRLAGIPDALAHCEPMRASIERASRLTTQLLAFSRRQVLQPVVLNLTTVIHEMNDMVQRIVGEHVVVVEHLTADVANVRADRSQVEQVLLNLLVNARDAMPDGGTMTISTRGAASPDGAPLAASGDGYPWVVMEVSDTGIGMTPEVLERIFEPFFTTKASYGTGLGLSTVYGIVKQSGGHIFVTSRPGQGSSFRIALPCTSAPAETSAGPLPKRSPAGFERILLVEDEKPVADLLALSLRRYGYDVLVAGTPDAALEAAEPDGHIDMMVTDVVMPGGDGRRLAEQIRRRRPRLPVIFMSGYVDDPGLLGGAVLTNDGNLLRKPFAPRVLAERIRAVLDSEQAAGSAGPGPTLAG